MGQTLIEKVLARASGRQTVSPGEFIWAVPDLIIGHDLNFPRYRRMMQESGFMHLADASKVMVTIDHTTLSEQQSALEEHTWIRRDAESEKIHWFFDVGRQGISHNLPLDVDAVHPGMLVLASDTRAPALGCASAVSIAVGIGLVTVLATGKAWLRVPETIRVNVRGSLARNVMSRDIAQWIANRIGYENGDYRCIEFGGEFIDNLDMDGRHTLCNAMVDIGVKTAVCVPASASHVRDKGVSQWVTSDANASYVDVLDIDAGTIGPQISIPPDPENVVPASQMLGTRITHAFVGSCIGGKMEDMRAAGRCLAGRKVAPNVRMTIIPATQEIYKRALSEGLIDIFSQAGAVVAAGICGPCYGTFSPLAPGDVSLCTATRNDPGRMGSEDATVFIANAAVVAASAVQGRISMPEDTEE